jgi:hypothetical protein
MDYFTVLEKAKALVDGRRPEASAQKRAAFANSVVYLVTGGSGGFGGPSVREHAVSHLYVGGHYSFDEAVELLLKDDGPIFGPLTDVHRECWEDEPCFDDDPQDVLELES